MAKTEFSSTLSRQREAAGFRSAWAFYKACGPRLLGCTYRAYYYIESGHSVPQPELAMRLAAALKIVDDPEQSRAFVASYLQSLLERKELADFLLRTLSSGKYPHGYATLFQKASKLVFSGKQVPLTQHQADVLTSNGESYWSWTLLSNDFGHWSPLELARQLGIAQARVQSALKRLAAERLLAKDGAGRYFCPDAGKLFVFPRDKFYLPIFRAAVKRIWTEMAERKGATLFDRYYFTRASEADIRNFFPHLAQTVKGAHVHSVWEKGPDTAYVGTWASVRKIMPF
ncbi:MAG: hypothetical protein HY077_15275 [Elusimicrobia bacterium]|nr:hypothetical protein [Elusimicrobiota bacterium]